MHVIFLVFFILEFLFFNRKSIRSRNELLSSKLVRLLIIICIDLQAFKLIYLGFSLFEAKRVEKEHKNVNTAWRGIKDDFIY